MKRRTFEKDWWREGRARPSGRRRASRDPGGAGGSGRSGQSTDSNGAGLPFDGPRSHHGLSDGLHGGRGRATALTQLTDLIRPGPCAGGKGSEPAGPDSESGLRGALRRARTHLTSGARRPQEGPSQFGGEGVGLSAPPLRPSSRTNGVEARPGPGPSPQRHRWPARGRSTPNRVTRPALPSPPPPRAARLAAPRCRPPPSPAPARTRPGRLPSRGDPGPRRPWGALARAAPGGPRTPAGPLRAACFPASRLPVPQGPWAAAGGGSARRSAGPGGASGVLRGVSGASAAGAPPSRPGPVPHVPARPLPFPCLLPCAPPPSFAERAGLGTAPFAETSALRLKGGPGP